MSSWGNLDNVALSANITCTAGSAVIANAAANATIFLNEVKPGDYLIIANQKYQVYSVNSNVLMTLTDAVTTTANVAFLQQGPKYISNVALSANTYTIQRVIGVDKNEANVATNNLKNIKTPGWNHYFTYPDVNGTRHKNEVLVAMSKNFNSNATLVLQTDATDDATVADRSVYFLVQPSNASNVAGANVVLTSNAATFPEGGAITYTWYESSDGSTYTIVNDGDDYSGNATNVLTVVNVSNTDGYSFFVNATTTAGGTSSANSDIATTSVSA
jgi:hypothetical protein